MSVAMELAGRRIGRGHPIFIVAELSANHNQSLEQALELVRAAKAAGADAVKLQTYTPDTITLRSDREPFRIAGGTLWDGRTLYDLYAQATMPWEWQPKLKAEAEKLGLALFSSAFDETAVDFLEKMEVPAHKVASFELVDLPLIEKMARTGKPLILSTGMATLEEIEEAVGAARRAGARQLALLKCTSAYPSPPEEMNLRTLPDLEARFQAPVGLSDHTLGIAVPVAAVALGACILEKHFTLSRANPGPDSAFSLEPAEFQAMVEAVRTAERALGQVHYGVGPEEAKSRVFRRSLFVVEDVKAGERFTASNLRSIRPAHGLHPRHLPEVLGRAAACDISAGTPLQWTMVEGASRAEGNKPAATSLEATRFQVVPLEPSSYAEWDRFCLESDDAWFWHTSEWLEYILHYRPETRPESRSFLLYGGGRPLAICPLVAETRTAPAGEVREFSYGGEPGPAPALASELSERARKLVMRELLGEMGRRAAESGVQRVSLRWSPLAPGFWRPSAPQANPLLRLGFSDTSIATQVVDLDESEQDLLRRMRNSHKRHIARAERELEVQVVDALSIAPEVFERYRALHAKAAGRVTRPIETFQRMYEWIRQGTAVLVEARLKEHGVGHILVNVYKDGAYYSSGCEDPEHGGLPIGHLMHWRVIQYLKHRGIRRYELGWQQYGPLPYDFPSPKEISISFFKRSFGGLTVPLWRGEKFYSRSYYDIVSRDRMQRYAAWVEGRDAPKGGASPEEEA